MCPQAGILAGCGRQKIGACVNLGSFYLVGVPCAVALAFLLHMKAKVKLEIYLFKLFLFLAGADCVLLCQKGAVVGDHICICCASVILHSLRYENKMGGRGKQFQKILFSIIIYTLSSYDIHITLVLY